tara:strand:+ start:1413 stop:2129 length:717 start_codon:yes stop_codon:yes gene_type:complete
MEWNIYCVKHGDKYSSEHVNRLYRMIKKNTTIPFTFHCLTEDPTDIISDVKVIPLDETLKMKAWWWKISLFQDGMPNGNNTYFDLDVIIQSNIDCLNNFVRGKLQIIDYSTIDMEISTDQGDFQMIRSFYNSSIMCWETGIFTDVYDKLVSDFKLYEKVYIGLDRFFTYEVDQWRFSPLPWIMYSRRNGPYDKYTEPIDTLRHHGVRYQLWHEPDYKVCIFNNAFDSSFYHGYEKYLL